MHQVYGSFGMWPKLLFPKLGNLDLDYILHAAYTTYYILYTKYYIRYILSAPVYVYIYIYLFIYSFIHMYIHISILQQPRNNKFKLFHKTQIRKTQT